MRHAFSLVELSIVLVILGLLTGGILAGQSLIRAAELRSVTTEYQRYTAAVHTFRDKYFALPGDFRDATRFWMRQVNAAHCVTNATPAAAVGTPGTCDGNNDGVLGIPAAASQSGESFQFWRQLAHAGLIEGTYSGLTSTGGQSHTVIGTSIPRARLNNAGWSVYPFPATIGVNGTGWANFEGAYGNQYIFGAQAVDGVTEGPVLKAEEAWNIDSKMDDGKPGTGLVRGYEAYTNCQDAGTSTTVALAGTANYKLSDTSISCMLMFNL